MIYIYHIFTYSTISCITRSMIFANTVHDLLQTQSHVLRVSCISHNPWISLFHGFHNLCISLFMYFTNFTNLIYFTVLCISLFMYFTNLIYFTVLCITQYMYLTIHVSYKFNIFNSSMYDTNPCIQQFYVWHKYMYFTIHVSHTILYFIWLMLLYKFHVLYNLCIYIYIVN